jgi:hypothetical protein
MKDAHGKLSPQLPWQKQHSTRLFTSKMELCFKKKLVKCYTWSIALYGAKTWTLRKQIRNMWTVLKCGGGEGWRRLVAPIT